MIFIHHTLLNPYIIQIGTIRLSLSKALNLSAMQRTAPETTLVFGANSFLLRLSAKIAYGFPGSTVFINVLRKVRTTTSSGGLLTPL